MIYFDNAATTFPKPSATWEAVRQAVKVYGGNPGRSGHTLSMKTAEKIYKVREKTARFFHAPVENVVFTSNCTHALNMAIKGVMGNNGHAVVSCLEHNSVLRPLYALSQQYENVSFDVAQVVPGDDAATLLTFEKLLRKDTKLVVCTHASNVTGDIMPIAELGRMCRERGVVMVADCAQTAGVLPINMETMNLDIVCTAGHKGIYGVSGTGLMVMSAGCPLPMPLMEGGTGSRSNELIQPAFSPDRFESGTVNTVGILSMGAGIDFVSRTGLAKIYRHEMGICRQAFKAMQRMPGVVLYDENFEAGKKAPVLLFNIQGLTSMEAAQTLSDMGFALRGGLHCAPIAHKMLHTEAIGGVRFAPSAFTSQQDVQKFVRAVSMLALKTQQKEKAGFRPRMRP